MNKLRTIVTFVAGLLAATAANAGDTSLTKLLTASVAALPAGGAPSPLHPATEAAIREQMAAIDARMTATLAAPADASASVATTELESR